MFRQDLNLSELISLQEWQGIQDAFAEALEVSLRTVSLDGKALTKVSRPLLLHRKIPSNKPAYSEICGKCILRNEEISLVNIKEETNFTCPFGLDLFVCPITAVGNRIACYMIIGPVIINRRRDSSVYVEISERLGIPLEELMDALLEISVFSYNKSYSVNRLIKSSFSYIAQTGYQKKRLGEMAPEVRKMDPLFLRYYEEKILNSMLNVCMLALDTDSGSVMTLDKKTEMLYIKVASRLDEDIVHNTHIKIGEGIAGVAAKTAEPIILPQDSLRNGLAQRMKRGYIKSSMIVPFSKPFSKQNSTDVYGVINLNIVRKDKNFSEQDIAFVRELTNLVSVALVPFQDSSSNSLSNGEK